MMASKNFQTVVGGPSQQQIHVVGGAPSRRLKPPFFQKGGLEGFDWKSPSIPLLKKGEVLRSNE